MTKHVHLLMTPDKADGISRVMLSLGRRYVRYVNFEDLGQSESTLIKLTI